MIKMYDFKLQYNSISEEIDNALQSVLDESAFSSGKYVEKFENEFSNYIGTNFCAAVNNGTSALHVALLALGIKDDDEVLVPTFSFFATCESVSMTGATPIFCDSDYDNFNIDYDDLEKKITNKTKAIICVHLFGQSCDMNRLKSICKKNNLYLIEDAAQAHGAKYFDKKIGNFGDLACFSFYPTKNLGSYGEGGAVTTNNEKLHKKIMMLRNHGSNLQYQNDIIGYNYRMTGFQGSILSVKLKYLDKWNDIRAKNAKTYNIELEDNDNVSLPLSLDENYHVYHQYVIKVKNRDKLKDYLHKHNIQSGIYYPKPCHMQKPYKNIKVVSPISEKLSKEVLALPIAEHLSEHDVKNICNIINQFYKK
tara:strand:- start:1047 stop:2141 length:1095 start_codon:yes stop_codon:yes gene_type:complete